MEAEAQGCRPTHLHALTRRVPGTRAVAARNATADGRCGDPTVTGQVCPRDSRDAHGDNTGRAPVPHFTARDGDEGDRHQGTATPALSFPRSIAEAEEGVRHPRESPPARPSDLFTMPLGTEDRRCIAVEGSEYRGIRSGDFVAGPFNIYPEQWRQVGEGKVWWQPLHVPYPAPQLTVRATLLDNPSVTRAERHTERTPGFYPSSLKLPSAGRWLLIATAGPDWGCFLLTVTS
jgi:hypothetical protein